MSTVNTVSFQYREELVERMADRVVDATVHANDLLILEMRQVLRDGEDIASIRRAAGNAIDRHIAWLPRLKPAERP